MPGLVPPPPRQEDRHDAIAAVRRLASLPVTQPSQGRPERRVVNVGPPPGVPGRRASDVPKPRCPWCGASESTVCKTPRRAPARSHKYDRRRQCTECGRRFPTEEKLDLRRFERELAIEGLTLDDLHLTKEDLCR